MNNYMQKVLHLIIHFKDSRHILLNYFVDCGRRDSNSHEGCSLEPKSSASTNFATSAYFLTLIVPKNLIFDNLYKD
jgi:hypothetical protein